MQYPEIKKKQNNNLFGNVNKDRGQDLIDPPIILEDNYYWLRDDKRKDEEILSILNNENKFTEGVMEDTKENQDKIYSEILSHIKEDYDTFPLPGNYYGYKENTYLYFTRYIKGKSFPLYYRITKKGHKEELLIDVNKLAKNDKNYNFESFSINDEETIMSYGFERDGSEKYKFVILNIETKEEIVHNIPDLTYCNYFWYEYNVYYIQGDSKNRTYQLWKYNIMTHENKLIFQEDDELFWVSASTGECSDNRDYIYISSSSSETDKIYIFKHNQEDNIKLFTPVIEGLKYSVECRDNKFLILTNKDDSTNFKLMITDENETKSENWKGLLEYNQDNYIKYFVILKNYLLIMFKNKGNSFIKVVSYNITDGYQFTNSYIIDIEDEIKNIGITYYHYNENDIIFNQTSLKTPVTLFRYNLEYKSKALLREKEVPNYNSQLYETKRVFCDNKGTQVPMSIIYKKDLFMKNGKNPLYLYGYGAYGITIDPDFMSSIIPLLNRGFIYVIAHVRGGSFLGYQWYKEGKMLNKMNSFEDLIACTEYLINNKYTSKNLTVISGGSAGGLLVSASMVLRPDLFKTVIADVPFVDVLNTMSDPSIPLTIGEWEEWGNPNQQIYFDYIKKYSPYDNIKKTYYPNILLQSGLNDPRVGYWQPTKFLAKLREFNQSNNLLLLKTEMEQGHSNSSDRYQYIKDKAFEYAFILKTLEN